jgi:hypothetical protein
MATDPKQVATLTVHAQKALFMVVTAESSHLPLTLAGVLVGYLSPIVGMTVLAIRHRRHEFPLRRTVTTRLVGGDIQGLSGLDIRMLPTPLACLALLASQKKPAVPALGVREDALTCGYEPTAAPY